MKTGSAVVILFGVGFVVLRLGGGSTQAHALLIAGSILIAGGIMAMSIAGRQNKDK